MPTAQNPSAAGHDPVPGEDAFRRCQVGIAGAACSRVEARCIWCGTWSPYPSPLPSPLFSKHPCHPGRPERAVIRASTAASRERPSHPSHSLRVRPVASGPGRPGPRPESQRSLGERRRGTRPADSEMPAAPTASGATPRLSGSGRPGSPAGASPRVVGRLHNRIKRDNAVRAKHHLVCADQS